MKNGVFYRGPSLIDGEPIVGVAIYSDRNGKTGRVLQTYIIRARLGRLKRTCPSAAPARCAARRPTIPRGSKPQGAGATLT